MYNYFRHHSTSINCFVKVDINDKNGIAMVSLDRKPVNALSLELFKEFCGVMDDLEKDSIRGMILKSVSFLYLYFAHIKNKYLFISH